VRIEGLAFTLFNTVPLIPMDALASAYSLYLGEMISGSSSHFQME